MGNRRRLKVRTPPGREDKRPYFFIGEVAEPSSRDLTHQSQLTIAEGFALTSRWS
jgi:hypothetical protein